MFDQTTLFMIFMMLCFAGIAAMFYFILRGLDGLIRELRGERSQLIGLMQSMEASVDLLVKSAQISLQRQATKDKAGFAERDTSKRLIVDQINIVEKLEEDLVALKRKQTAVREIEKEKEKGANPLKLHPDNTK